MAEYESKGILEGERPIEPGIYIATGEEGARRLREAAYQMGIDTYKADFERTRQILSTGTPLSEIVKEMRER